jgi:hypothetical protein
MEIKVGQNWDYDIRDCDSTSSITICKIDKIKDSDVIHICVHAVKLYEDRDPMDFPHLPFSKNALEKSLRSLAKNSVDLPSYEDGYEHWREEQEKGNAGWFTIPVKEVIDGIAEGMKQNS